MSGELAIGDQVPVQLARGKIMLCRVDKESTCRYCRASMFWATTPNEKPIPLDPPNDEGIIVSHWATCPYADEARADAARRRAERPLPGAGL